MATVHDILNIIKEKEIKMVDFKMVDINGQYRHVTIPAENFSEETMKSGIGLSFVIPMLPVTPISATQLFLWQVLTVLRIRLIPMQTVGVPMT